MYLRLFVFVCVQLLEEGNDDKHNLISPNEATLYFTIKGLLFSKYISI